MPPSDIYEMISEIPPSTPSSITQYSSPSLSSYSETQPISLQSAPGQPSLCYPLQNERFTGETGRVGERGKWKQVTRVVGELARPTVTRQTPFAGEELETGSQATPDTTFRDVGEYNRY